MRAVLVVLAACGTAPPSSSPLPPPSPAPADAAPEVVVADAPSVDARATIRTTGYARQIVMASESRRRTFQLVRTGDHVELDIRTQALRDRKRNHLDGHELDDASWSEPLIEHYAGAALDIDGETKLDLFLTERTKHPTLVSERGDRLEWTCRTIPVNLRALAARPERIAPPSTAKTGCSGSPVRWVPPAEREETVTACGPVLAFGRAVFLPFTETRRIEWIAEWNDCHIQELAFREAAPI